VPALRDALAGHRFPDLRGLLEWLGAETAAMTPGADPLPALKAPVAALLREWSSSLPVAPLTRDLDDWTRQRES
jgi:hypothetical protein